MTKYPQYATFTLRRVIRLLRLYYGLSMQADDRSNYHKLYYGAYCELLRRKIDPERFLRIK